MRDLAQKHHLQMRMQRPVFNLPVLQFLQWPLLALQNGTFPDRRADHYPWNPSDETRSSVAGDKIGIKGILCRITGDWMEYCSTVGFTCWASTKSPCPFCENTPRGLVQF